MTPSKDSVLRVGTKVLIKDHRLYKDDISTPLAVTMQSAVIVKSYRKGGSDLLDVKFDRDGMVSKGHFADSIKESCLHVNGRLERVTTSRA